MAEQGEEERQYREYRRLEECEEDSPPGEEEEEQLLLHVTEGPTDSWHHVKDLDSFFTKIYQFHQRNGFACVLLSDVLELVQFLFVVAFSTFLLCCVDYDVLFATRPLNHSHVPERAKVTLPDAVLPAPQCARRLRGSGWLLFLLVLAGAVWLCRLVTALRRLVGYWEIRSFYIRALGIPAEELCNHSWQSVQARLLALQRRQPLCVPRRELTELDIHHRILRFRNYTVAMVNKSLLPVRFRLPLLGPVVFLTRGLQFNLELLLFRGPAALFQNTWSLRPQLRRGAEAGAGQPGGAPLVALRPPLPAPLQRAGPRAAGAAGPRPRAGHAVHGLVQQPAAGRAGPPRRLLRRLRAGRAHRAHRVRRGRADRAAHPDGHHAAGARGHGGQVLHPGRARGVVPGAAAAAGPGARPLPARALAGPRRPRRDAGGDGAALPVQGGFHPGGAAEPPRDAPDPHLRLPPPRPGHRGLLPQLHGGGGGRGRHLLLRAAGRAAPRQPAVAVAGTHGGGPGAAGGAREDGAVADALRPEQSPVAAAAARPPLPRPPAGAGDPRRGHRAPPAAPAGRGAAGRLPSVRGLGPGARGAGGQRAGGRRAGGPGAALWTALQHGQRHRQPAGVPAEPAGHRSVRSAGQPCGAPGQAGAERVAAAQPEPLGAAGRGGLGRDEPSRHLPAPAPPAAAAAAAGPRPPARGGTQTPLRDHGLGCPGLAAAGDAAGRLGRGGRGGGRGDDDVAGPRSGSWLCREPPEVPGEPPRAQWGARRAHYAARGAPSVGAPCSGRPCCPRYGARAPGGAVFGGATGLELPVVPPAPAEIKVYTGAVPAGCARGSRGGDGDAPWVGPWRFGVTVGRWQRRCWQGLHSPAAAQVGAPGAWPWPPPTISHLSGPRPCPFAPPFPTPRVWVTPQRCRIACATSRVPSREPKRRARGYQN